MATWFNVENGNNAVVEAAQWGKDVLLALPSSRTVSFRRRPESML